MANRTVDPEEIPQSTSVKGVIVVEKKKDVIVVKKKKKKKYSRNLKGAQQFERRISKSARRVSRAVGDGIDTYLDERDKSLERRRDGALIESYVNVAEGLSKGISEGSPALVDLAEAVNSKRTRRVLRNLARALPRVR